MDSDLNRFLTSSNDLARALQPMRDAQNLRHWVGADLLDAAKLSVSVSEMRRMAGQFDVNLSDLGLRHLASDAFASIRKQEEEALLALRRSVDSFMPRMEPWNVRSLASDLAASLRMLHPSSATLRDIGRSVDPDIEIRKAFLDSQTLAGAVEAARTALYPFSLAEYQAMVDGLADAADETDDEVSSEEAQALRDDPELQAKAATAVASMATELQQQAKTLSHLTREDVHQMLLRYHDTIKDSTLSKVYWYLFIALLVNVLGSIVNLYLNYYGTKYLDAQSNQQATKQVKQAGRDAVEDREVLKQLRFASAPSLAVKTKPAARAPTLGQLKFGQMVQLIQKDGDFALVAWRSEESKAELQGWVFSRYLKRFEWAQAMPPFRAACPTLAGDDGLVLARAVIGPRQARAARLGRTAQSSACCSRPPQRAARLPAPWVHLQPG